MSVTPTRSRTGAQQPVQLLDGAAAEVLLLVPDGDHVGVAGGDLPEQLDQVVLPVTHDARGRAGGDAPVAARRA